MASVTFQHDYVGDLVIDNGINSAQWGYNLNSQTYPTYGGEVVQILSVYIDHVTLQGTCATYRQIEAIYSYFAAYLQTATQGKSGSPKVGDSTTSGAYNLSPVKFHYPERNWVFDIYPQSVPGFRYGREVVAPTWQMMAFVIDDSPDLDLIKSGLKALAVTKMQNGDVLSINSEISPESGNPDTDPWETYLGTGAQAQATIQQYATYYNNILSSWSNDDFSSLTLGLGSNPNPPAKKNASSSSTQPGATPSGKPSNPSGSTS